MKFKDLKVGDNVWYVPTDSRHKNPNGSLLEVSKVGRKYVHIEGMKAEAWEHNGYVIGHITTWPHGSIYACEKDFLDFRTWKTFEIDVGRLKLSKEQKQQILTIVGVNTVE